MALVSAAAAYAGIGLYAVFAVAPEQWLIDLALYGRVILFLALLVLAGALTYRVAAAFTLSYDLDRNGLYINWLGNRAVVPLDQILHLDIGLGAAAQGWNPLNAIGYYAGQRSLDDGRLAHRFATAPNTRALIIHTSTALYAISPKDTEAFVQDLEQRRNLGAAKSLASTVEPGRMFLYAFWHDPIVRRLLLMAFVINLLVMGLLAARYNDLALIIQMRYNATGDVVAMLPRHEALFMPFAAFLLSLVNMVLGLLLYRSQMLGARLLQAASVLVQILFGIAVITVLR
ncbi:MAG: hypothetical protein H7Z42_03375 [Roseiflexaceae bacterium]|nr:hypothetical protein [Roseiflexaceae bacterium]